MWSILYTNRFEKNFKKLNKITQKKVMMFLSDISADAYTVGYDIKKMQGEDGEYRCRIGDYRILYQIRKKEVVIIMIDVDHRKDIYN